MTERGKKDTECSEGGMCPFTIREYAINTMNIHNYVFECSDRHYT